MEPALIAWMLVAGAPLGLALGAAMGWREIDRRAIGRVRKLIQKGREKSDKARREMEALLHDAKSVLERQAATIGSLRETIDVQSPALRAAIEKAPRQNHQDLADHIGSWFSREEVESRNKRNETKRRIEEIERAWFGGGAGENECAKLLCENLWLLEPDLVSAGHVFADRGLNTIARGYFPGERQSDSPKFLDADRRADVAGVFYRNDMMNTGALPPERVFVIIEAKAVSEPVTPLVMDEAFHYALNLRKLVPSLERWNIECYALGGTIAEGVHRQHFRVGPGPHAISVTPITWNFLLQRAKSLDPARLIARTIDVNGANPPSFLQPAPSESRTAI